MTTELAPRCDICGKRPERRDDFGNWPKCRHSFTSKAYGRQCEVVSLYPGISGRMAVVRFQDTNRMESVPQRDVAPDEDAIRAEWDRQHSESTARLIESFNRLMQPAQPRTEEEIEQDLYRRDAKF